MTPARAVYARALVALLALFAWTPLARAQIFGPSADPAPIVSPASAAAGLGSGAAPGADGLGAFNLNNPLSVLAGAASALPGSAREGGASRDDAPSDSPASGTSSRKDGLSTAINILLVLSVVALAPSILLMCTCFLRIVIVLGLLKQALGTQSMPPSQVLLGLALIMTLLVMGPTLSRVQNEALGPWQRGEVQSYDELWAKARQPLRDFMFAQIEATGNWSSVYMILNYRGIDTSKPEELTRAHVDMTSLVPAFVLSELKVAFLMGFRIYLPFLVIDMVISSLLISMSMMMLPPVLISLPFKLLLFVMVDGWTLVCGSLMQSFVQSGAVALAGFA